MTYSSEIGSDQRSDEMRHNQVKGNLVLSRRWYLSEHLEGSALNRVLKTLPTAARALLERQVMPFSWYDFGSLIDVDLAIIQATMGGRVEEMQAFGHALGVRDFGTVYRVFMAMASPEFVLRKVTSLGSLYFKESTLSYIALGPNRGSIELIGRCMPRYMCQYGITGWLVAVLEAANAHGIRVEHARCVHHGSPRCEWQCRWSREGSSVPPRS